MITSAMPFPCQLETVPSLSTFLEQRFGFANFIRELRGRRPSLNPAAGRSELGSL